MNIQEEILAEAIKRYPKDLNSHEKFIEGAKWAAEECIKKIELQKLEADLAKEKEKIGGITLNDYLKEKMQ